MHTPASVNRRQRTFGYTEEEVRLLLLPMAKAGLDSWGVPSEESDYYLGIIEQRCLKETSGAAWFVERVREREGEDRFDALRHTLLDYRERMHSNEPVHLWD